MADKPQKVLLTDDEPINIRVLHGILEDQGYEFIFATNGSSALEQAVSQRPDIILLDVMMPEMDGYEVCRRLKDDPVTAEIPIIFVSAMNDIEDETAGLEAGAIDYITKPLSAPIVRARVHNHLQMKAYRDRLTQMAMIDGLTGVANRRRFEDVLEVEWKRARRQKSHLSLIMMDIDFFKPYNDNYGHVLGDDCLKSVATILANTLQRPADLVARYGGEEFICVLPDTASDGATVVAEQLLTAIRDARIPHAYSEVADFITMSMGCLTIAHDCPLATDRLVDEADKLLYKAKTSGRNRIISGEI